MIDDPEKTALFISRLKELLPINAGIAKGPFYQLRF